MKKRALCALLAVLLCLSLLPVSAMSAEDTVAINESNFPDPHFRSWLQAKYGDFVATNQVTEIVVPNQSISNLKGIEHFTGLTKLYCDGNQLTSLDVSKNTGLTSLCCDYNQLTSLDVSKNTSLTYLNCTNNKLKSLDVSKNTSLTDLYCYDNQLTSLDVSKNTSLTYLYCDNNQLTSLDVSKNTGLKRLYCHKNQLTSLDISRNPHLLEAYIKGEKKEFGIYTRYSVPDKYLYVDPDVKIVCLSVTAQPKSQTAAAGKTATLSVEASGYDLQYQWYVQKKGESTWTELTGETKQELTVTAAKELDGSSFRCEITGAKRDGKETLTSEAATLTIVSKPKITTQPKAASVKAGKKVTFKVKASGGSLTYQWYRLKPGAKKWEKINKATKASYSFKAAKKWNGYKYKCLVKNKAGKVYTKAVKLTVK